MARNIERDEREAERRKKQLLNSAFNLFSTYGIDAVSMKQVADDADVGTATMYNYYNNKVTLVEAVSYNMWKNVIAEAVLGTDTNEIMEYNAYQLCEYYCDCIIDIFMKRPEVLRFSSDFKTFLCRFGSSEGRATEQLKALEPMSIVFKIKYGEAKTDHSIRTDIPELELFSTIALTMLSVAERFAQGVVWADNSEGNHLNELKHQKEMILGWLKG